MDVKKVRIQARLTIYEFFKCICLVLIVTYVENRELVLASVEKHKLMLSRIVVCEYDLSDCVYIVN